MGEIQKDQQDAVYEENGRRCNETVNSKPIKDCLLKTWAMSFGLKSIVRILKETGNNPRKAYLLLEKEWLEKTYMKNNYIKRGLTERNIRQWQREIFMKLHLMDEGTALLNAYRVCQGQELQMLKERIIKLEKQIKKLKNEK